MVFKTLMSHMLYTVHASSHEQKNAVFSPSSNKSENKKTQVLNYVRAALNLSYFKHEESYMHTKSYMSQIDFCRSSFI